MCKPRPRGLHLGHSSPWRCASNFCTFCLIEPLQQQVEIQCFLWVTQEVAQGWSHVGWLRETPCPCPSPTPTQLLSLLIMSRAPCPGSACSGPCNPIHLPSLITQDSLPHSFGCQAFAFAVPADWHVLPHMLQLLFIVLFPVPLEALADNPRTRRLLVYFSFRGYLTVQLVD